MTVQPGNLPVGYENTPVVDVETGESQYDNAGNRLYTRTNYQVPDGGVAGSGLAALAAKTEEDWMGQFAEDLLDTIDPLNALFLNIATTVMEFFSELVDLPGMLNTLGDILNFFYDLLDRAGLLDFIGWLWNKFSDVVESVLKPIFDFLDWLWQGDGNFDGFGNIVDSVLKPIFEVLGSIFDILGRTVIEAIVALFDVIAGFIDIPTLQALIEQIVDFIGGFLTAQQFADLVKTIFQFFDDLTQGFANPADAVVALVSKIPLLGPLVSKLTGKDSSGSNELDLTALGEWARGLENDVTVGVAKLEAAALKLLSGRLPVGQISDTPVNILTQGDFLTESTVEAKDGWSWDGSQSRTGTGGSLKATCTNSEQRIYCRQDIKVATGDRLTLTGYVGTSPGFTSGSMRLSIQPWGSEGTPAVMTPKTVINGTARTTSASSYAALPQLDYTVPAGVTSVQVSLVANCNVGCNVYFDDIRLTKTGVLPQGLVTNLLDAINGILAGTGYYLGQGWTKLQEAVGLVTGTANGALNNTEETNTVLFNDPDGGQKVIPGALDLPGVASQLGTAGSGGIMYRTSGTSNLPAGPGTIDLTSFYNSLGTVTSDITASASGGSFTVTHAGYYQVEVGFTVNATPGAGGGFTLAPGVKVGGTLSKIGSTAHGQYFLGSGSFARTAHSTFIVYLAAGQTVSACYYQYLNFGVEDFFAGGGANNYFSIAMLNRTQEG